MGERASLAYDLILALDELDNFELSSEQKSEIQRRVKSVQEGRAVGRSVKEVFASIRAKFDRFSSAFTFRLEAWLLKAADKPTSPLTKSDFSAIRERVRMHVK